MSLRLSAPSTGALLLPLLSVVACGGGSGGTTAGEGTTARPAPEPAVVAAEPEPVALPSDLDGRSIRRVGLVRFEVSRADAGPIVDFGYGYDEGDIGTAIAYPEGDLTTADAAFTTLEEPLDEAALARIGAMSGAGASGGCYPIDGVEARSIGALFESLGTPSLAGEAITVSNAAGSWFELQGHDYGYGDGPFYTMAGQASWFGALGAVETGTTIDVPGDAFPAFAAVDVPSVGSLSGVVENETEARWSAGTDPDVPVVIDVRFHDYVGLRSNGSDADGVLTDDDFGYLTDGDLHTLVGAPVDMRCVTRDTGRFAYPAALQATMAAFREAGQAVAGTVLPGSDLETVPYSGTDSDGSLGDPDGSLTDEDVIEITQGRHVDVSRVATRYRVEDDALLIVQSSNGGTL